MKYWHGNLLKLRQKSGLSQEKLSLKLGIKRSKYSKYEEFRCEPNIELIISICFFYKISIDDFLKKDL